MGAKSETLKGKAETATTPHKLERNEMVEASTEDLRLGGASCPVEEIIGIIIRGDPSWRAGSCSNPGIEKERLRAAGGGEFGGSLCQNRQIALRNLALPAVQEKNQAGESSFCSQRKMDTLGRWQKKTSKVPAARCYLKTKKKKKKKEGSENESRPRRQDPRG